MVSVAADVVGTAFAASQFGLPFDAGLSTSLAVTGALSVVSVGMAPRTWALSQRWSEWRLWLVSAVWLVACAGASGWMHFDPNPCAQAVLVVLLVGWGIVSSGSAWVVAGWTASCVASLGLALEFSFPFWLGTASSIVGAAIGQHLQARLRRWSGRGDVRQQHIQQLTAQVGRLEQEHAHLRRRLGILTESLTVGVFEADFSGRCQFLTPYCAEILNVSFLDAFIGSWFDYLHVEDRLNACENWQDSLRQQEPLSMECRIIAKDGGYRWVHVRCCPLISDQGSLYIGTMEIITEQRRTARQLQYLADSLEKAHRLEQSRNEQLERAVHELHRSRTEMETLVRKKGEFLANMSHEIRTPMTAILGFTEMMLENLDPQLPHAASLQTIRRNADYLLELLNGILDMSKIEAGQLELELIPCSPRQIAEEVRDLLSVRVVGRDIELCLEVQPDFPVSVHSDPTRLKQILMNLVGNALKFTEQGTVKIELAMEPAVVEATATSEPGLLQLRVRDTGIGLSPEQLTRVFRPFTQGDSSTSRKYGGSGLGLAISQSFAERMGGRILVESAEGVGSCFTLSLPAKEAVFLSQVTPEWAEVAPPEILPLDPRLATLPTPCRILLAEDCADNQRLVTYLLSKAGAEVTLAVNGAEALLAAIEAVTVDQPYDAVLMDLQMPLMDGFEATRRLRAAGYLSPIVALTASIMASDRQKCLEAGCTAFVSKPINRLELLQTLTRCITEFRNSGRVTPAAPASVNNAR